MEKGLFIETDAPYTLNFMVYIQNFLSIKIKVRKTTDIPIFFKSRI
ncbi:hypothetical protein [Solibacillus cecembensis]